MSMFTNSFSQLLFLRIKFESEKRKKCKKKSWELKILGLVAVAENLRGQFDGQNSFEIDSLRPRPRPGVVKSQNL